MKSIVLVLALMPLAAQAGSATSYTMKGKIVGFTTEKNGVCHLASTRRTSLNTATPTITSKTAISAM